MFVQGQSHRLEIVPHDDVGVRGKMYELSTDEEDEVTNKMKKYERKIDELMNEVGTLRNEVRRLLHSGTRGPIVIVNIILNDILVLL